MGIKETLAKALGRGEKQKPLKPTEIIYIDPLDPVLEPRRAQLEAFKIPGVVNGYMEVGDPVDGKVEVLDWDRRDEHGNPILRTVPADKIVRL